MYKFLQEVVVKIFDPKLIVFPILFFVAPVMGFSSGENYMTGSGGGTSTIFQ